jgi:molecular chaperone HscB
MLEEGEQEVPQSFLMDMMEINEALMELEMDYDEDQFESSMNDIQAFEETLENNFQKIAKMWEEAGFDNIPSELYEDLKDYYLKNRYLLRIKENLSKFASR